MPTKPTPKRKPKPRPGAEDPNTLVRQRAGIYATPDDRFEVRQASIGWYLVDSATTNEFGQELVLGPFGTLDAVRTALPDARRTTLKAVPRPKPAARPESKRPTAPPPPPPSWIDELPRAEVRAVRALIVALEREGVPDAEAAVKADRRGRRPVVATRLLETRLERILAGAKGADPAASRALVGRVLDLLTVKGSDVPEPLRGWQLVELGGPDEGRTISIRRLPEGD